MYNTVDPTAKVHNIMAMHMQSTPETCSTEMEASFELKFKSAILRSGFSSQATTKTGRIRHVEIDEWLAEAGANVTAAECDTNLECHREDRY